MPQLSNFEIIGMSSHNDEQSHFAEVIAFRLPSAELAKEFAVFMTNAVAEALAKQEGTKRGATYLRDTTEPIDLEPGRAAHPLPAFGPEHCDGVPFCQRPEKQTEGFRWNAPIWNH